MKAVKIWCEYDFGGNVSGNVGVYSSRAKAIAAVDQVLGSDGMDFETLNSQGLAEITEIII